MPESTGYSGAMFQLSRVDVDVTRFIDNGVSQAQRVRDEFEPHWRENWENYRVEPAWQGNISQRQINPYAANDVMYSSINQLKTTESHQIGNTLTAVLMSSLYGVREYVQWLPVGIEDVGAARKTSKLTMYGLERPGGFRTQYATLKDAVIFGTGFWKAAWDTQVRTVPRRLPVMTPEGPLMDPETGQVMTVMQNVTIPVYDDIDLSEVSIWDIWCDPAATRFDRKMDYIIERFRMDKASLEELAGTPGWVEEGIRAVLTTQPGEYAHESSSSDPPKLLIEGLTRDDVKHLKEYGYHGGYTFSGRLPREIASRLNLDPRACNTVAIINGIVVFAQQTPNPYGDINYGAVTILPTGSTIYGLSPLTVTRYLQDVSDTELILTVQAAIEAVYQNYLVGGQAGVGPNFFKSLERRKPRQALSVPGDVTQVIPLPKDYAGFQIASATLMQISQIMRQAANARDPLQGQMSSDRTTATETSIVSQSALQNVDQIGILIEREDLPRQCRTVLGLYYLYLDDEGKVIARVGEDEAEHIAFHEIDLDRDVQCVGARDSLTRAQVGNQFRDFMTLVLSNPLMAAQIDFDALVKRYGDEAMHVKGLSELVIRDPDEIVARLQAMGMARSAPSSAGGPPEGTPAQNEGRAAA